MKLAPLGFAPGELLDKAGSALRRHFPTALGLACAMLLPLAAHANIVLGETRVIYPANEREVTLRLSNQGSQPALVQAWVDDGNQDSLPDELNLPFMVMPPLARIDPGKGQTLRIAYAPDASAPKDRESVFWLNVLDVPPMPTAQTSNHMQLAFRSRVKLFFRPAGLPGSPADAAAQLRWRLIGSGKSGALQVRNDSAFHVSFSSVTFKLKDGRTIPVPSNMLAPKSVADFRGGNLPANAEGTVVFEWINDYGTAVRSESRLDP